MTPTEFQQLKDSFRGVHFDAELETQFYGLWEEKTYEKKQWITEAGRTESYFFYVLEGVQAVYFINNKGEKVVIGFSYQGDFSGAYESFLMQAPSVLFVEALQASRMLAISYTNYQKLFDLSVDFNKWARLFLEGILIGRGKREVELINLTAKERYIDFMRRCPDVLRDIPQKYLASYLNMKPETFSRLRSSVRY
ncbi:MAG: Crp/Fnr family transcriptional regulator [Saprospiraceae bacterium]